MRYLSVCSGIEAASCAWHSLGWEPVAFAEIEPFPSAVLAHHYPDTPNWGDMSKFKEWPDADVDVLVGGTPCQSFSVAGLRKGLADPRGNLMLTYLAIADRYRPTWMVWENVPGVLSSNGGRDFGTFLGGMGELGYGFAYRVLDAQYVRVDTHARAVPQRRRRVFVVGHLGDWRRAAAVLFEHESLCGHPAPRREEGQGAPASTARSVAIRGRDGTPQAELGDDCANTILTPNGGRGGVGVGAVLAGVAHSLRAQAQAQASHRADTENADKGDQDNLVLAPVPRPVPSDQFCYRDAMGLAHWPVAFDTTQVTSKSNYSNPMPGDPCHPLAAGAHPPVIAIQGNMIGRGDTAGPAGPGWSESGESFTLTKTDTHAVAFHNRQDPDISGDVTHPIGARDNGMGMGMQVRRLTPLECERLQGFPDGYTLIQVKGKPAADGPRYKALGNSMAVNVMRHIGSRIQLVAETLQVEREAA